MHWDTYVIHWCYIGTKYPSKLPNNDTCQHEAEVVDVVTYLGA